VQLNAFGLNNFTLGTQPLTRIGPGEIRIRVGAVSLSFRDLLVARGQLVPYVRGLQGRIGEPDLRRGRSGASLRICGARVFVT
jgi:NADPH:quinone reductase-like Zn-dependent oxidoreductase